MTIMAVIERASRDAALPLSEFGIVVGYKAQKTEYERRLADKIQEDPEWAKVIVGTIDEMEGREVGIEIFDLTITAQKQNATQIGVGFLADDRRVNVAVTRAKYGLVIFSDRDYMKRVDQFAKGLKALCDHLKGKGRPWKGFEKQSGDGKRKRSADDADDANDGEKKRKGAVEDGEELEEGEILED
jgi:superfamily I DNA and/or RNA helicase